MDESREERPNLPPDDGVGRRDPTVGHPLNAKPRPKVTPLLAVLALVLAIAAVFVAITWLRYNT